MRKPDDQEVEFVCLGECGDEVTWMVEGRFNAEGEFEDASYDEHGGNTVCPECGEQGEPTDSEVKVADV